MKVRTSHIKAKLVILNAGRIWVLNCPNPLTCPQGLELLQGKGIQIQPLIPFKLPFTPMGIFPILFFKIHKLEQNAVSIYNQNPHLFGSEETYFPPSIHQNILKIHSGHNLLPLLHMAAGLRLQWAIVFCSPGAIGISWTPPMDVNWR